MFQKSLVRTYYQTSIDRDLRKKQEKFPKKTQQIYIEKKEVKTYDNYTIVEPLIDPSQKPHELHLVKKVKSLIGEPWWVKNSMRQLGFNSYMSKEWKIIYNIHPNTTEINNLLWVCKHVVKVTPIKFKNGYPTENDFKNTILNLETGEFEIIKSLKVENLNGAKQSSSFPLTKEDMMKSVHRERQLLKLNDEYFPTEYNYRYGQDNPLVIKVKGRPCTSINEDEVT